MIFLQITARFHSHPELKNLLQQYSRAKVLQGSAVPGAGYTGPMNLNLLFVFLSAALIIGADALIKKVAIQGSFWPAFYDPWMALAYLMYFVQILLAIGIFVNKGELAVYTNLFIVFYSLFGVMAGILFFKETLSSFQMAGVVFAIIAAILLNWR